MKRLIKGFYILLAVSLLTVTWIPALAADSFSLAGTDLKGYTVILHTNDTHGRAVQDESSGYMGYTAVSALKKEYEAAGAEVILLDAGDTLHGLPFATLDKGESIVKLMNLAGYDAMTPGNHDFNYGTERLLELSGKMDFPLLSSNVTVKDTGEKLLKDNIIIEKNGVKYGIFGLSTPETSYKTNPKNVESVSFDNPVEAAKEEVASLKSQGAQFIIALAHLGLDKSSEFTTKRIANEVDGIELMVDGHSHTILENGVYVKNTLIVSTGEYIKNIGVVTIDQSGNINASLVNLAQFSKTDAAIDKYVSEITKAQADLLSAVVGKTSVVLDGLRENVRAKETNLGDLTADAMRSATGADVALTNGGGIRASIEIGDITNNDLVTVFPFGNYVVTKKVSGKAILAALEVGVASYPETLGGFPQVSGISFQIDASKPSGSRVVNAKINGKPLDKNKTYLFATNDFIAAGGDNYTMFANYETVNEYGSLEEIIGSYIKEKGNITIQTEKRISVITASAEEKTEEAVQTDSNNKGEGSKDTKDTKKDNSNKETKDTDASVKNNSHIKGSGSNSVLESYEVYAVEKGDCLTKIAVKLYGSEAKWKDIFEWNKDTIKNPDIIYIGQKLKIYNKQ